MSVWDVIVIGAGPAGSTAAALLAESGHQVLLLEREHFPRFHIGESLLPLGLPVLCRLGIAADPDTFAFKSGAEFVCEATARRETFSFDQALPGAPGHAWQVDRARFDTTLRDAAVARGAVARHGEKVTDVTIDDDQVRVTTQTGTVRGRYVVDATGQDRLLARRGKTVQPYKHFGKSAAYLHLDGLSDATIDEIGEGNDIRIMMLDEGWAWLIPLPNRRLSVGVVSQRKGLAAEDVATYVETSPLTSRWAQGATVSAPGLTRNFSYQNGRPFGARFGCIGDAACFLDPVFSSGVSLALTSAEKLADRLSVALHAGTEANPRLLHESDALLDRGYATFAGLIHRFYNTRFADNMFFGAPKDGELRAGVISVLAGDVFRADNTFQDLLLGSRRHQPRATAS